MKNKWKISFLLCLATLVVTNIFWAYTVLDSGVTNTYQQVTFDEQEEIIKSLGSLIVNGSNEYTKKDILHLLRQAKPQAFIVEEGNEIIFERVMFTFQGDKLVKVSR